MRKVKLDVDELAVESFELAAGQEGEGTVRGRAAEAEGSDYAYMSPDSHIGYCTVVTPTCVFYPSCAASECWTYCEETC